MAINKYFQDIDIQFVEESDNYTKIVAEPFDRGYGPSAVQMHVSNDINFCIRIMAQVLLPPNNPVKHPYLRGAAKLRTDRC